MVTGNLSIAGAGPHEVVINEDKKRYMPKVFFKRGDTPKSFGVCAESVASIGHLNSFIVAICRCNRTIMVRQIKYHPLYAEDYFSTFGHR